MKDQNKFWDKKLLVGLIFILFFTLSIYFGIQGYSNLSYHVKNYEANSLDIINQRMSFIWVEINNFPRSSGNDILFFSRFSSLENVVNPQKNHMEEIEELELNFLEFLRENTAYYKLRYIDEFGREVAKVYFDGEQHYIASEDILQDEKDRYCFKETMKINEGEVYVSRLDLNIEDGEVENRGDNESPIYIPMIRYATPVFNNDGERKGIVVSDIYADYFLEDIRRSQREGEEVLLIDQEGYYLAHPDRSKEYGFMFDPKKDNFYDDYSISKDNLIIDGGGRVETEDSVFTFKFIYPTVSSFEVHKGSEKILGDNSEERYHWILVSISDREIIETRVRDFKVNYLFSLFFFGLIVLVAIALILVLVRINGGRRR